MEVAGLHRGRRWKGSGVLGIRAPGGGHPDLFFFCFERPVVGRWFVFGLLGGNRGHQDLFTGSELCDVKYIC